MFLGVALRLYKLTRDCIMDRDSRLQEIHNGLVDVQIQCPCLGLANCNAAYEHVRHVVMFTYYSLQS